MDAQQPDTAYLKAERNKIWGLYHQSGSTKPYDQWLEDFIISSGLSSQFIIEDGTVRLKVPEGREGVLTTQQSAPKQKCDVHEIPRGSDTCKHCGEVYMHQPKPGK